MLILTLNVIDEVNRYIKIEKIGIISKNINLNYKSNVSKTLSVLNFYVTSKASDLISKTVNFEYERFDFLW